MDFRSIAMGIIFALIWSSAFSSARIIVADAAPIAALALRFAIAGLVGVAIARALGQSWRLTQAQWRATILFGICQNALYLGLNFIAMQTVEASIASIIASTMPLIVAFLGWSLFRDRLSPLAAMGLLLGFAGVLLIMGTRLEAGADRWGMLLCVLGALALAIATLALRSASSGGNLLMIVGLQMLVAAVILGIWALLFEPFRLALSTPLVLAFLYTTFVPGLLATWIWFNLVDRIGTTRAATFHFLNPFFGVAIAALLLGEHLGLLDILGVAVIATGIFLVQIARQKKT